MKHWNSQKTLLEKQTIRKCANVWFSSLSSCLLRRKHTALSSRGVAYRCGRRVRVRIKSSFCLGLANYIYLQKYLWFSIFCKSWLCHVLTWNSLDIASFFFSQEFWIICCYTRAHTHTHTHFISLVDFNCIHYLPLPHLLPQQNERSYTFSFKWTSRTSPTITALQQPLLVKDIIQFICLLCWACQIWWLIPYKPSHSLAASDLQVQQPLDQGCLPSAKWHCSFQCGKRASEECMSFVSLYCPCL